jgi:putative colanic acid biosynthesis acetyltransferase WcaF
MEAYSCIGPDTDIYNAAKIVIREGATVSQYSYLCTATHDIRDKNFALYSLPIVLEKKSWVAAKCFVGPGVTVGEGAVVGASASVYKDVPPWSVVGGNPARVINNRIIRHE